MTPKVLFSIFVLFVLILTGQHAQAESDLVPAKESVKEEVTYIYTENKEKVFTETVDQFYEALRKLSYPVHQEFYHKHKEFYKKHKNKYGNMDTALYKDMPDASVSIREKVLFNEVVRFNYLTLDGNLHYPYPDIDLKYHQTVSPNRQVYFFYSFKDTELEFRGRYAVYDVETKNLLAGGGTSITKYPKYKKYLKR